nr:MAG TPA: hypothetical protein [Caudoviricetes sp.]
MQQTKPTSIRLYRRSNLKLQPLESLKVMAQVQSLRQKKQKWNWWILHLIA